MVDSKKVVEEMKKYNSELDRHLPNLNLDYLNPPKTIFQDGGASDSEGLILSNLVDLRTEMALFRKNIGADLSVMVMDVVGRQQKQLSEVLSDSFKRFSSELRESVGFFIKDLSTQVLDLKKEVSTFALKFSEMDLGNSGLKKGLDNISSKFDAFTASLKVYESGLEKKVIGIGDKFEKKVVLVEKEVSSVGVSVEEISKEIEALKREMLDLASKSRRVEIETTAVVSPKKVSARAGVVEPAKVLGSVNSSSSLKEKVKVGGNENRVSRILDIDEKLKRLDALK